MSDDGAVEKGQRTLGLASNRKTSSDGEPANGEVGGKLKCFLRPWYPFRCLLVRTRRDKVPQHILLKARVN